MNACTSRMTRTLTALALPIALLGAAGFAAADDRGRDNDRGGRGNGNSWGNRGRDNDRGNDRSKGWDRGRDSDRDRKDSHGRTDPLFRAGFGFRIDPIRVNVNIGRPVYEPVCPPVVISRPAPVYVEQSPEEICFEATQCHGTITLKIHGTNHGAGFRTTVASVDTCERTPLVSVCNTGPRDCAAAVCTPFSLTSSFRAGHTHFINVVVAGRTYRVGVTQV